MNGHVIRPLITAFAFLTRLPVRAGKISDRDLGRSVGFFPLVGLLLGLLTAGLAYALVEFFPPTMVAVLLVAASALLTGGLHLDGLSDLFDGLAGGQGDRQRTLAIMRDSRIGAQGAVALVLVLAAKIAATSLLVDNRQYAALVAVPVISRFAVVPSIVLFPYTREEGLGRAFNGQAGWVQLVLAALTLAAVLVAFGLSLGQPALAGLLAAIILALALRAKLGGLTGDVYGATIELVEVVASYVATMV
jgi:adenosylcobinamide-GDP ribazoletransferase